MSLSARFSGAPASFHQRNPEGLLFLPEATRFIFKVAMFIQGRAAAGADDCIPVEPSQAFRAAVYTARMNIDCLLGHEITCIPGTSRRPSHTEHSRTSATAQHYSTTPSPHPAMPCHTLPVRNFAVPGSTIATPGLTLPLPGFALRDFTRRYPRGATPNRTNVTQGSTPLYKTSPLPDFASPHSAAALLRCTDAKPRSAEPYLNRAIQHATSPNHAPASRCKTQLRGTMPSLDIAMLYRRATGLGETMPLRHNTQLGPALAPLHITALLARRYSTTRDPALLYATMLHCNLAWLYPAMPLPCVT